MNTTMDSRSLRVGCALALACWVMAACGSDEAPAPAPPPAADAGGDSQPPAAAPDPQAPRDAAATGLVVAFLLDRRITTSTYTGDRWVVPQTFTLVHEGDFVPVHARAHVASAAGTTDAVARWESADPEMVAASLPEAHQVELTVRRPGATTLTVAQGELSRTLSVTATRDGDSWRVDVSQ